MKTDHVLILGSAPDATRARKLPRDGLGAIVAINNAWRVRADWNYLVHPSDFPVERRPECLRDGQSLRGHEDYVPAVNAHGGFVFVGGTMAFTAAYWALQVLKPSLMTFLGCDMVYSAAGNSHFYGEGTADPLRPDPTLQSLEAKSARFMIRAVQSGCAVANLSELPTSRLVFPRISHRRLAGWTRCDTDRLCVVSLTRQASEIAREAQAAEKQLAYEVPTGKYWKELERFDPEALRRVDALWLSASRRYSEAA